MPLLRVSRPSPGFRCSSLVVPCGLAFGVLFTESAGAQDQGVSDEFSAQRFNPAPGPKNFVLTRTARVGGEEMQISGGLMANYGYKPFVVVLCRSQGGCDSANAKGIVSVPVVENMVATDLMGAANVLPNVQASLRLPVAWANGHGLADDEPGPVFPSGVSGAGLGDPEVEGKARLYGEPGDDLTAGAALSLTAPIATLMTDGLFLGDPLPTATLRGIADAQLGPLSFGANLGAAWRPGSSLQGKTLVGPEARYSAAAAVQPLAIARAVVELSGASRISGDAGANSVEALFALQGAFPHSPWHLTLGGGAGVLRGIGTPHVRAFLGISYADERRDRDEDGLFDDEDECPLEAEDRDGFSDSDGCPEPDNDLDTVVDSRDKCPNVAEDPDGFEDLDGCPEADNDKDGIPDNKDQCRDEPETRNGYKDTDGCPDEKDMDEDGVPDSRDKCPDEVEDTDGFEDTDGCPEIDNDKDGVPDALDECGDEPETINDFEDQDGCPDELPE